MTGTSPPSNAKAAMRAAVSLLITGSVLAIFGWMAGPDAYLWMKAFHVVAIIAWMAGMLYLPRLFIYHCEAPRGSAQSETFKIMERRLLRYIVNPAMVVSWGLGLWLAWRGGYFAAPWFHGKLALVLLLSAVHGYFSVSVRRFAADANTQSQKFWRFMNEVPTVLMIGIVILVIVKPF